MKQDPNRKRHKRPPQGHGKRKMEPKQPIGQNPHGKRPVPIKRHPQNNILPELTRLNKYIANAGICSRRQADEYILAGLITVNGVVIRELGYKIKPGDIVKFGGDLVQSERKVYILLNKPKDYITTTSDPNAEKNVLSLIRNACKERVYPVGRLDRNTTGVLLLTNDGEITRKLTHPSSKIPKVYAVLLDKAVLKSDMIKLTEGITLEDGFIAVDSINYIDPVDKSRVGVEIHSGRNRIIRRMFEHLGYRVRNLDRVLFAGLTKKNVQRGKWRLLTEREIGYLKMLPGR